MSETAEDSLGSPRPSGGTGSDYSLHSDLARLCLPAEYKDSARRLAWANSICALFLAIGIFGIQPPKIVVKPLSTPEDIIPIVFTEPETAPPEETEPEMETPLPEASPLEDAPSVPVVVVANSPSIAFAVPVKGATILAPAKYAAPPPLKTEVREAPKITRYNPGAGDRSTPQPEYPLQALKRGYQGKVIINFVVSEAGAVTKAEISQSSGYTVLDDAALSVVKNRWRFPTGDVRYHYVEIIFQLK